MDLFSYAKKTIPSILQEFEVDPELGLDQSVVAERIRKYGLNRFDLKNTTTWNILLRQFQSAFIYLLIGAGAITFLIGEKADSFMIFIFLSINVALGFFQEYHSEKIVKLLSKYTLPKVKVLRGGKIERIISERLVPGDVIILETGDRIPADVRFLEQQNLEINETILTGESLPVYKQLDVLSFLPKTYYEAHNLGFCGTDVVDGKAKALIIQTGKNTVFGKIAKLSGETTKISDYEQGIADFSKFIVKLVSFTLFVVFFANITIKSGQLDILGLIIFSIALTVSVIPEGLPLVTTFSLSIGARRLARNSVIVKRLSSIEDLGGIDVLCSDKTGTLTENELKIANVLSDDREQTFFLANLASAFDVVDKVEPFDIALEKGLTESQRELIKKAKKIAEEPFDPTIRRNTVLVELDHQTLLVTRGAPEIIVALCHGLGEAEKEEIIKWIEVEGKQGQRVLAIASKVVDDKELGGDMAKLLKQKEFKFVGIVSFVDPIKISSYGVARQANELGVRIIMITGDSPHVAGVVAHEVALVDSPDNVITGEKWETLSGPKKEECLEKNSVFARISPEQKYEIIQILREKHSVGFLGEGINDAPALKIASVSIVVNSAADIARETADIILLKQNLKVVLDGVREGRQTFANTTKYIKATLSSNFGNFFAVAIASMIIDFLPMLPIQILLLNLLSDTPMIAVSSDGVDEDEITSPKRYDVREIVILAMILGVISMIFDFIFFAKFYRMAPSVLQTNWFIGSVLTEIIFVFSIRTKSFFLKGSRPSKLLLALSILVPLITVSLPFTLIGQTVFQFTPPTPKDLGVIFALAACYFACTEVVKVLYYKAKLK